MAGIRESEYLGSFEVEVLTLIDFGPCKGNIHGNATSKVSREG